ncbi:MAG: TlpA family protein disulfide reductase [Acidimicrobiales bacterium]|nr:TlpA family protein disulfide reductase [Acidimicrobiales bacterium]MCB9395944.1 TlpA family protein disulfide reductase [Acidimicrobiaceae bacterium]
MTPHHPRRSAARRAVLTVLPVVALLAACGGDDGGDDSADRLPAIELSDLITGDLVDASALDGPAVVNLWATWCAPCRQEMPAFQAVSTEYDDVRFVGVNQGDAGDAAAEFLDEVGVTFDQYLDPNGELTNALEVVGLPATFVIDAEGTIVAVHNGALDEQGIRDLVAELDAV